MSPIPIAMAPLIVAISITSCTLTALARSLGVPTQGTPRFQVKRIISNMSGGAMDVASLDNEIVSPAARIANSAARASPVLLSRSSECVAKESGVFVRAIAIKSSVVAGT
ncbi:hypothetical protein D3C87_1542730 [compost metagenome]